MTSISAFCLLVLIPFFFFSLFFSIFFFFNDTATTEIYTLSLHDALPICGAEVVDVHVPPAERVGERAVVDADRAVLQDRKSTRLNSSHTVISYAVFCLKKKKKKKKKKKHK